MSSAKEFEPFIGQGTPVKPEELRDIFRKAFTGDTQLTQLDGFRLNLSANSGFHKIFFATRCTCKTAGLLSVEVSNSKTTEEVKQVMPQLVRRLRAQAKAFMAMPCDTHAAMRLGGKFSIEKA